MSKSNIIPFIILIVGISVLIGILILKPSTFEQENDGENVKLEEDYD